MAASPHVISLARDPSQAPWDSHAKNRLLRMGFRSCTLHGGKRRARTRSKELIVLAVFSSTPRGLAECWAAACGYRPLDCGVGVTQQHQHHLHSMGAGVSKKYAAASSYPCMNTM